ncbi:MAG: glycosyltransferase family 2 protein [Candidatus Pacebacteria bacterium]|nr:glycosyltransferase family 2 protein [Candidatus Paceibacterota bacterium]
MSDRIKASVGILTFNNADTIERALESVKDFDDILLIDGGSTDATLEIAARFGARVVPQDQKFKDASGRIIDFSGVHNQHLSAAQYRWCLYIDSDEYLSQESVAEIRSIVERPIAPQDALVYELPRKTIINGVCIDCATAYPSYQKRFFHLDGVSGFIKPIHERINPKPGVRVAKLIHPQFVPLDLTPEAFYQKQRRYLALEVERHKNDTTWLWLTGVVYGSVRSSLAYLYRHIKVLLFCRGTPMPLWVEWSHHWYNWNLIVLTGATLFSRPRQ